MIPQIVEYCAAELHQHDRPRFLTLLFAPEAQRGALAALYAFNLEVAKTRSVVREPIMGQIRLQWWRDALAEIYDGKPPRAHQVVQPLADAIARHQLPRALFDRLIEAREADLEPHPPGTLAGFEAYIADTAGTLGELAALILDADPAKGRAAAEAHGIAGLLLAVPHRAALGRIDLPLDLIAASGITAADIRDGRALDGAAGIIRQLVPLTTPRFDLLRGRQPKPGLAALLPATLAVQYLKRLRRADWNPFRIPAQSDASLSLPLTWAAFWRRPV